MPRLAARISGVLTKREDIALVDRYRLGSCRIVLLCKQGVNAIDAVLRWVIHPTIVRLILPSEIYCVYICGNCGLNFDPMRLTSTPTIVRTMQDDGVIYDFY